METSHPTATSSARRQNSERNTEYASQKSMTKRYNLPGRQVNGKDLPGAGGVASVQVGTPDSERPRTVGRFFRWVRLRRGFETIDSFARELGFANGVHLGRIEGDRRPAGPDYMRAIEPHVRMAGEDPLELLRLWLLSQELPAYAALIDVTRPQGRRRT